MTAGLLLLGTAFTCVASGTRVVLGYFFIHHNNILL